MATSKNANQPAAPNLESFACFWLDEDVNSTEDNQTTQHELRQVINHLRTFDNSDECKKTIRDIRKEKIVLIISGSFGRLVVPRLHNLPQLSACYVFCRDKKANEEWAKNYCKVKGVFVERGKLVAAIIEDQIARSRTEDGVSISVINYSSQSIQSRNAIFMWFQLFIEVLLRMHHKTTDRKELIDICQENYKGNKQEMNIIDEFEKTYKAENAIWWCTRESCLFRMINKALRVQDYDILFALRFFITDIAKQIKTEHKRFIRTNDTRSRIHVYRGQLIGIEIRRDMLGEDHVTIGESYSSIGGLHLVRVDYDRALVNLEKAVKIQEETCSSDPLALARTYNYMGMTYHNSGKSYLAVEYYNKSLKILRANLPSDHPHIATIYNNIGVLHENRKDYKTALEYYQKSLEIKRKILAPTHADLVGTENNIGKVGAKMGK